MRARYYDATTEQSISRDPLEGATNQPYTYAGGNPVNFIDPTGMAPEKPWPTKPMWGEGEMPLIILALEGPEGLALGLAAEAAEGAGAAEGVFIGYHGTDLESALDIMRRGVTDEF